MDLYFFFGIFVFLLLLICRIRNRLYYSSSSNLPKKLNHEFSNTFSPLNLSNITLYNSNTNNTLTNTLPSPNSERISERDNNTSVYKRDNNNSVYERDNNTSVYKMGINTPASKRDNTVSSISPIPLSTTDRIVNHFVLNNNNNNNLTNKKRSLSLVADISPNIKNSPKKIRKESKEIRALRRAKRLLSIEDKESDTINASSIKRRQKVKFLTDDSNTINKDTSKELTIKQPTKHIKLIDDYYNNSDNDNIGYTKNLSQDSNIENKDFDAVLRATTPVVHKNTNINSKENASNILSSDNDSGSRGFFNTFTQNNTNTEGSGNKNNILSHNDTIFPTDAKSNSGTSSTFLLPSQSSSLPLLSSQVSPNNISTSSTNNDTTKVFVDKTQPLFETLQSSINTNSTFSQTQQSTNSSTFPSKTSNELLVSSKPELPSFSTSNPNPIPSFPIANSSSSTNPAINFPSLPSSIQPLSQETKSSSNTNFFNSSQPFSTHNTNITFQSPQNPVANSNSSFQTSSNGTSNPFTITNSVQQTITSSNSFIPQDTNIFANSSTSTSNVFSNKNSSFGRTPFNTNKASSRRRNLVVPK